MQPLETAFHGADDLVSIESGHAVADGRDEPAVAGADDLGGEDDGVARLAFEPAADDFFGEAVFFGGGGDGVDLGDVEEVDAFFVGVVHDAVTHFLICLFAEGHGAHADFRGDETAFSEATFFHICGAR